MAESSGDRIRVFTALIKHWGGFQRIRCYGFLANRYREQKLARCRELLGMPAAQPAASEASKDYSERYEELTGSSSWQCPVCTKVACW